MIIPACTDCQFGTLREDRSHCSKEKCYSYLPKCIADKALADYLQRIALDQTEEVVVNQ